MGREDGWVSWKSVGVKLVAEMEEKASRLAGETTGGGEVEVGGNQEVGNVFRVNVAGDCFVVAGGAGSFKLKV